MDEGSEKRMANRDIKLDQYKISKYAYRELHNFCLQYPEKKKELTEMRYSYSSPQITGMPKGNKVGNPTAQVVERMDSLIQDIELIEQTAQEVDSRWNACILLSVTEDVPWHYLRLLKDLEPGKNTFNKMRRKFYYLLAKKKNII